MALYPEGSKLDNFEGRFALVNLAARRALQITRDKAPALVETQSLHPLTIAMEEIAQGAVVATYEQPVVQTESGETFDSLDLAAQGDNIDNLISSLLGAPEKQVDDSAEPSLSDLSSLDDDDATMPAMEEEDEEISFEDFGGKVVALDEEIGSAFSGSEEDLG